MQLANLPEQTGEMWRYTSFEKFPYEKLKKGTPAPIVVSGKGFEKAEIKGFEKFLIDKDSVSEFVQAYSTNTEIIRIKKDTILTEPIRINYNFPADGSATAPSFIAIVEEGATVTFIENLDSKTAATVFSRVEIIAGKGSNVRFVSLQDLSRDSIYHARHRFHGHRDSVGEVVHVVCGSAVSRLDLDAKMLEPGCSWDLISVAIADGERNTNIYTSQEHCAPHCRSDLYCKAVASDSARSVYYGYIRVAEGAQKTDAYQTNRNLLLSKNARVDSVPNLEIKANDVKCSHGSSTGQVGAEEMFYLLSRGLTKDQAERLLVEGFLTDLIGRIKDKNARAEVEELVMARFHSA